MLDKMAGALALKVCEYWARQNGVTQIPATAPWHIQSAWAIAVVVFDVEAKGMRVCKLQKGD